MFAMLLSKDVWTTRAVAAQAVMLRSSRIVTETGGLRCHWSPSRHHHGDRIFRFSPWGFRLSFPTPAASPRSARLRAITHALQ